MNDFINIKNATLTIAMKKNINQMDEKHKRMEIKLKGKLS